MLWKGGILLVKHIVGTNFLKKVEKILLKLQRGDY